VYLSTILGGQFRGVQKQGKQDRAMLQGRSDSHT